MNIHTRAHEIAWISEKYIKLKKNSEEVDENVIKIDKTCNGI